MTSFWLFLSSVFKWSFGFFDFAGNFVNWILSVSYTHLDVYKRQVFIHPNWIKVTGNRFLPIYSAVFIRFFDSTFGDASFVKNHIRTFFTIHHWSYKIAIHRIDRPSSLFFQSFHSFRTKIRLCLLYTSRCV